MARAGFFDDNRNRAYPFLVGTVNRPEAVPVTVAQLPNTAIVDCGFTFGPTVFFDSTSHKVYLARVRRVGNLLYFEFACTCPDLAGVFLTFVRNVNDDEYLTEFTDSGTTGLSLSYSASGDLAQTCFQPLWTGYLVTGPLEETSAFIPSNQTYSGTASDCVVEPGLLRAMYKAAVTSINLANDDRTRYVEPEECLTNVWPFPQDIVFVNARCVLGTVLFSAGYNTDIKQSSRDNSIVIAARVGAGEGQPCQEIPLYAGEVPPEGSGLLSGGSACGETIQTINGISSSNFTVQGSTGIQISSLPETNTLVIDVNLAGSAYLLPTSLVPA